MAWSTLWTPLLLNKISVRAPFVPNHSTPKALSLNRGGQEPLAHHMWYLHVRMFPESTSWFHLIQPSFLVGSLSQLLTTSWISSGGVVLTGGQYGSVAASTWLDLRLPALFTSSVDLLLYTPHLSWGCNTCLSRAKRYDPLQLPGLLSLVSTSFFVHSKWERFQGLDRIWTSECPLICISLRKNT